MENFIPKEISMKQIILTALFAVIMLSVYGYADDGEK